MLPPVREMAASKSPRRVLSAANRPDAWVCVGGRIVLAQDPYLVAMAPLHGIERTSRAGVSLDPRDTAELPSAIKRQTVSHVTVGQIVTGASARVGC